MTAATTAETLPSGRLMAFDPPPHWEVKPLGYLFDSVGGATPSKDKQAYWEGSIPWVSPKDMKVGVITDSEDHIAEQALRETRLALLPPSVVLIVVRGMILSHTIPVAITAREVTINQDMKGLFARRGLLPDYLDFLLRAISQVLFATIEESGHGTRCLRLDLWRNILVGVPPQEEQRRIIDFIRRKTAQIDALIAKKQRQIELLGEKRQALISHAVTKGLDPTAPMKPSGIPWLGDIPANWRITPLGYLTLVVGGSTPSKENVAYWDGDVPWVSPKDMKRWEITDSEDHISTVALRSTTIEIIEPPAVLVVVRGMILLRDVPIAVTRVPVTINQDMKALITDHRISADFLSHYLRAIRSALSSLVEEAGHGTRCLRTDLWRRLPVLVPPEAEQRQISSYVEQARHRSDRVTEALNEQIAKLQEYRQTLISAAVTGKIRVPMPEEVGP